jgi:hypothetical protein
MFRIGRWEIVESVEAVWRTPNFLHKGWRGFSLSEYVLWEVKLTDYTPTSDTQIKNA